MAFENQATVQTGVSQLETHKVIRNTYMMLSLTLLFSALMATVSLLAGVPGWTSLLTLGGALVLVWFVLPRTAHSAAGLGVVFAITGLLGFGLGPMLSHYLALPNGGQIVMTALGGTGAIFLGLSGYALVSRRDFSFMGGFLVVGLVVVLAAMLGNIFLEIPALSMAISAAVVLLMSGFILYDTGRMVNGGEDNYLLLTVSLYLNIFNLFVHLLSLLGMNQND
ncbi:BAX inhibitor (BI)-1/YccA family protein [Guyparkeria halophila]|uniref:BAX inhibitor (BI)-1/YccA family protein n=1 Tax=Guyparkeria halophila TaxID=47960 RepID=A0A6I6CU65_9GAMM|nr:MULTISPECIES: Bax inhibitor-1/YccA family protein [Guyparkeria]QGT77529.1 BAX inhibitor (BI)-1/YccA family protein [Guyparkeria halophila]TKA89966.1 Bax inhibitor-1/YccA family protein [Guyparkeria sp. SB14A]